MNGYLTTPGMETSETHRMIADLGFEVEDQLPTHIELAEKRLEEYRRNPDTVRPAAEILNWRVQKLLIHPDQRATR